MDKEKIKKEMKHTLFMNVSYGLLVRWWEENEHITDNFMDILVESGYGNIKNVLKELADEYDDWGEKRFRDYEAFVNFAKKYGVEL